MPIQDIALSQLELSPLNVRKTRTKQHIEQMAASIEVHGLLQNLRVHEVDGEKFGVAIGGTRLEALRLLLKQKKIPADYPVPCDVRPANDPTLTEASLAENFVREGMHPADEFDAFKKLADEGQGPETIAARFGASPTTVKQRLKLAVVSPKLIAVYRKDGMTLEQLMAFTLTDDHKKQEKVWRDLPVFAKERGDTQSIRSALTDEHVAADSKLARFVGLNSYQLAGGSIMRDLFETDAEGWLTDSALVNRLAEEKLAAAADQFSNQGWKWTTFAPEIPHEERNKFIQLRPSLAEPDTEAKTKIDTLQGEADTIMAEHGEEPQDETAYDRLAELQEKIGELSEGEPVWTLAQKAQSGVLITIAHNGEINVQQGVVRPEDKAAARKLNGAAQEADNGKDQDTKKEKGGLSAALITELTSHKTAAAQLVMATNGKAALLAITHALAIQQLYMAHGDHSSLGIRAHGPSYSLAIREVVNKSAAAKKLATIIKGWQKKLPKQPEKLWAWLEAQTPTTLQSILAACVATTIDVTQVNGAKATAASADLAKTLKLNMADHWEATADNYLTRVPKKHLLAELNGELKPATHTQVEGMKRDQMAKVIGSELKGKRWLPDILKVG
jgi:ParB family chromosome partitioning protein